MTIDGDLYRKVLGRYPTGVTLVTGIDNDEPLAIVIGSFTSVSMDPPLVGFFIGTGSQTWKRIEKSGSFCVNVLTDQQVELSNGFFRKVMTNGTFVYFTFQFRKRFPKTF